MSVQLHAAGILFLQIVRPEHTEIRLGNLHNQPMSLGEEKNLFALPGIELRILGMPAGSLGSTSTILYCLITFSNNPNLHYFKCEEQI